MDDSVASPTPIARGRGLRTWMSLAVAATAATVWLALRLHASNAHSPSEDNNAALPLITVVQPSVSAVPAQVRVTGLISARNDIPIGNEGDPGRISAVLVEPGDHVHRGQVLARLSAIAAQSLLDTAEASLEEARAGAAVAESEWSRAERDVDIFSREESERRRAAALTARAKVKGAQAQVIDARNKLAHTFIRAPADGVVLERNAEVGQIAVPGSTILFHLARGGEIEMRCQVADRELPKLS